MIGHGALSDPSDTLSKVMVLYFLNRAGIPLTRVQIATFFSEKGYESYVNLQTVFARLAEAGLIQEEQVLNRTLLHLTEEGRQTLTLFSNELTAEIKNDIDTFLKENGKSFQRELQLYANYHMTGGRSFLTTLRMSEQGSTLLEINISLPSEKLARETCRKWSDDHEEIYSYLMDHILSEEDSQGGNTDNTDS